MSPQEFLCRHSSCVALQLLVATENSLPSCFVCHDRDFFAFGYEFLMLCRDRIFFIVTGISPRAGLVLKTL